MCIDIDNSYIGDEGCKIISKGNWINLLLLYLCINFR